jgi:hypothetical protein
VKIPTFTIFLIFGEKRFFLLFSLDEGSGYVFLTYRSGKSKNIRMPRIRKTVLKNEVRTDPELVTEQDHFKKLL